MVARKEITLVPVKQTMEEDLVSIYLRIEGGILYRRDIVGNNDVLIRELVGNTAFFSLEEFHSVK